MNDNDPDIGLSKPQQIARTLAKEILSGGIAKGSQLASENALVQRFSVSRNTVRKGLEELTRQGLITTKTGIGSFVTYDGSSIDVSLGWTKALATSEDEVQTKVLGIKRKKCRLTQSFLSMDDDAFLCIDRLRVSKDDIGISLERSRTPWRDAFEKVLENGLIDNSVDKTLASEGLIPESGEEWANVLPALPKKDAEIMGRDQGQPMLRLRRVTRNSDGDLVEFVESILDPKRFGLHLTF